MNYKISLNGVTRFRRFIIEIYRRVTHYKKFRMLLYQNIHIDIIESELDLCITTNYIMDT